MLRLLPTFKGHTRRLQFFQIVAITSSPHQSIPLLVFAPILDSSPQIECRLHMYIAPSHLIPLSVPSHSQRGDLCLDCLDSH